MNLLYNSIKKLGYKCTELSEYTGFKEMLDGRVKTLHPKIHAGILHDRQNKLHKIREWGNVNFEQKTDWKTKRRDIEKF